MSVRYYVLIAATFSLLHGSISPSMQEVCSELTSNRYNVSHLISLREFAEDLKKKGDLIIEEAVCRGMPSTLLFLLDTLEQPLPQPEKKLLHLCVKDSRNKEQNKKKYVQLTRILLQQGVSPLQVDDSGKTPLHHALLNGDLEEAEELLGYYHAEIRNSLALDIPVDELVNMVASFLQSDEPKEQINSQCIIEDLLRKNKVSSVLWLASKKCFKRKGILRKAIELSEPRVVRDLIQRAEFNVDETGDDGRTLLHTVARKGCEDFLKVLLDNTVMVDVQDKEGITPLHLALAFGHQQCARELVAYGADRGKKDLLGRTPDDFFYLSLSECLSVNDDSTSDSAHSRNSDSDNDSLGDCLSVDDDSTSDSAHSRNSSLGYF